MYDVKKTALYYPEIAIPSKRWIRQSILFFDEIASIVPSSIQLWTEKRLFEAGKSGEALPELAIVSQEIEVLKLANAYRPIFPEFFIESDTPQRTAFENEFLSVLTSREFNSTLGPPSARIYDSPVHINKAPPRLIEDLVQAKLAKKSNDTHWINFESTVSDLYMTLLAKYLAQEDWQDTVACTSSDRRDFSIHAFRKGEQSTGICAGSILIKNVLPCPRETTRIEDILEFKDTREHELHQFRSAVGDLESKISKATSVDEIKHAVQQFGSAKNVALAEFNKSFGEFFREGCIQSIKSLVRLGSPTLWLSLVAGYQQAQNITSLPISATLAGLTVTGTVEVGATFLSQSSQRRDQFRNSAYSYVYHVERTFGGR